MIPTDPKEREKLVELTIKRAKMSAEYVRPWHEKWVRYYKIYRALADAAEDPDEPNIFIPYAFGIIEDIVSKITEPILQLKPPCRVQARRKGHEKAAENFSAVAREYYSGTEFQLDYTEANREKAITGNAWDKDGWANEWREGKRWAKVKKQGLLGSITSFVGKIIPMGDSSFQYMGYSEVKQRYPHRVGFNTTFPSVFDIYPEPNVKKVKDMHWLIEQERTVALEDLQSQFYTDSTTGQRTPVYDLTELLKDTGNHDPGAITPINGDSFFSKDFGKEAKDTLSGRTTTETTPQQDMDRVHLIHVWEKNRVFTIAQGKYLIRVREFPFHVPRIPFRLRMYTADKQSLYGIGAVEPAEDLFYEFNDIHNLSMSNWIRIINKMVAVHMDAVPFPDDFKPRAGGKVRIKTSTRVQDAIASIDQSDVTPSMLMNESNTKGLIERVLSVADFSPGTEGTKQTHKTMGGLMEIQQNLAQRFTTTRRLELAAFQDQMWFMERLFSQFQFDPIPISVSDPSGVTSTIEINLEDIWTDGEGFNYILEHDPSYGDEAIFRNQMMVLLDLSIKYESFRLSVGDSKMLRANVSEIMRKLFRSFGWYDTSEMLKAPDGTVTPDAEFEMMLQGIPVQPNPQEDLIGHLVDHVMQQNSPKLAEMVQSGKVKPETVFLLKAHTEATMMLIQQITANPLAAGQSKMAAALKDRSLAGAPPGGMPPQTQTNVPEAVA